MTRALRRLAADRLDRAIAETAAHSLEDRMRAVHNIRRRIKELRGLLRLVQPDFKGFHDSDRALRDIARELSEMRDAKVRLDTFLQLADLVDLSSPSCTRYRSRLEAARIEAYGSDSAELRLKQVREDLRAFRAASQSWQLQHAGRKAVFPGLRATYAAGYTDLARARESHAPEDFHDWRKHVKYHAYHAYILTPIWPEAMMAHSTAATQLGSLLGQHHDLVVLAEEARKAGISTENVQTIEKAMEKRRKVLERQAFRDGARLFADTPEALGRRWSIWYRLWQAG
ncbi:CHAD domain-containing protein [Celeribacter neptunius]|nr:CHAD domain-containing protein [Celeribacter neptunius]